MHDSPRSAGPTDTTRTAAPRGFPRRRRLLKPADFKPVLKRGKRTRYECFTASALRSQAAHARLGLTVAKKSIPKAVHRNRFKRVCRELFRTAGTLPAVDIVILASSRSRVPDSQKLAAELSRYFEQLRQRWPAS